MDFGKFVVDESHDELRALASGSEVALALEAAELLAEQGTEAMVLSVMWREQLDRAMTEDSSLLPGVPVVWIEAGAPTGWRAVAREGDSVIGLQRFGESGRGQAVAEYLGLSASSVAETARRTLGLSATADATDIGA